MKKILLLLVTIFFVTTSNFAQCNLDRHNTTWYDGWTSCTSSLSPNVDRGESHWIMYNLGYKYQLKSSYWWNYNEVDQLNNGAKTIVVDYSEDGFTWNEWGTFELQQASGTNTYEGSQGPDFNGLEAQYLLFTILNNHGGDCYGVGEVKIDVDFISTTDIVGLDNSLDIAAYPNPFKDQVTIVLPAGLGNDYNISIEDVLGQTATSLSSTKINDSRVVFNGTNLRSGVYFVVLSKEGKTIRKKVLKVE